MQCQLPLFDRPMSLPTDIIYWPLVTRSRILHHFWNITHFAHMWLPVTLKSPPVFTALQLCYSHCSFWAQTSWTSLLLLFVLVRL